jgi:predicted amidophosphoribosyltransferase
MQGEMSLTRFVRCETCGNYFQHCGERCPRCGSNQYAALVGGEGRSLAENPPPGAGEPLAVTGC